MTSASLDQFWADTLQLARQTPLDATIEQVKETVPFDKYRITYKSLGGIPVRAYLAKPIIGERSASKLPVIVTAPGYGGWEMGVGLNECLRGYMILQVYPRSQGESGDLWRVPAPSYEEWIIEGMQQPEGYYYQGALSDLVRGIDYLIARPDVDAARIGFMSTSQGGFFALGTGAIDDRIKTVVADLPALCDFTNNAYWARTNPDLARNTTFHQTYAYFDPVNLAPRLKMPVLISSGGNDKVCPPETIAAVFNRLPGIKSLAHYPELAHRPCSDFYEMAWHWIERYL